MAAWGPEHGLSALMLGSDGGLLQGVIGDLPDVLAEVVGQVPSGRNLLFRATGKAERCVSPAEVLAGIRGRKV